MKSAGRLTNRAAARIIYTDLSICRKQLSSDGNRMLYFILVSLAGIVLSFVHFSFYFPLRKWKWPRIPAGVLLLLAPFFLQPFYEGDYTGYLWPLLVIAYALYTAAVFHLLVFKGGVARILFGVFLLGSFAGIDQILNHMVFLYILDMPADPSTFQWIRAGQLVFYLLALPLLYKYARKPILIIIERVDQQGWPAAVLPSFIVYMFNFFVLGSIYASNSYLTFLLSLAAVANTISYYFYEYNIVEHDRRTRFLTSVIDSYNRMVPYFETYNAELNKREKALRTIRHDLRHVLGGLTLAAREGDMEGLLAVVGTVSEMEHDAMRMRRMSDNKAVDGVVSFHFSTAARHGVKCSARLFLPEPLGVPQVEVVMLFGNALENCVKAAIPLGGNGSIAVSAKAVKDCLVIKTINNFIPGKGKRGEGLGLASMRMVCERHNGRLDTEIVGDEFRLTAILKRDPSVVGADSPEAEEDGS